MLLILFISTDVLINKIKNTKTFHKKEILNIMDGLLFSVSASFTLKEFPLPKETSIKIDMTKEKTTLKLRLYKTVWST